MTKTTITERINGIAYESLTKDDFDFLVERALKSVRKGNPNAVRKPSKTQVANEALKPEILNVLDDGMTARAVGDHFGISVQKASAILNQMVTAGTVAKVKDGKALLFKAC